MFTSFLSLCYSWFFCSCVVLFQSFQLNAETIHFIYLSYKNKQHLYKHLLFAGGRCGFLSFFFLFFLFDVHFFLFFSLFSFHHRRQSTFFVNSENRVIFFVVVVILNGICWVILFCVYVFSLLFSAKKKLFEIGLVRYYFCTCQHCQLIFKFTDA